jgi:hypothetical protein
VPTLTSRALRAALWLVPRGAAGAQLRALVQRLAPELPAHHTPHATLRCHLATVEQARAVAAAVAAVTAPFQLRVGASVEACHVSYAPEETAPCTPCRAVHAAVHGAAFEPACRAAAAALGEAVFTPHAAHVSLAYRYGAPYTPAEVAALDALAAGASACAFLVDRIAVATTRGLWPEWAILEELPLLGGQPQHGALAPAEAAAP